MTIPRPCVAIMATLTGAEHAAKNEVFTNRVVLMVLYTMVLTASCGGSGARRQCIPGQQVSCPCPGGGAGAQTCNPDSSGFTVCTCPEADMSVAPDMSAEAEDMSVPRDLSTHDLTVMHDLTMVHDFSEVHDLASVDDLAGDDFAGVACGNHTCGTGEVCCSSGTGGTFEAACVTGSTCADGGIAASCDGPEDCSGGAPNCCIELSLGGSGSSPSGDAMCIAGWPASVMQNNGSDTIETRLCHSAADCTSYSGPTPVGTFSFSSCCTYTGVSYHFCAPSILTGFSTAFSCD